MKAGALALIGCLIGQPCVADSLMWINGQTVVIDNLVEPDPHSECELERKVVYEFNQTLNIMLSSDVSVRKIGTDALGRPVVQLVNEIDGGDAVQMLVNANLARTNQNPVWCK